MKKAIKSEPKIKEFWDERAIQGDVSPDQVTHRDVWQRWLEIRCISRYLRRKDRVLDVGCGNGYSTRIFAGLCCEIVGIDFSAEMIRRATEESHAENSRSNISFHQHDILNLTPDLFGTFDTAITERCLINLRSFAQQKRAITNIASVLKPGGRFIFVEGSAEGREQLNRFRRSVGLSRMPRVWHNVDFKRNETLQFLGQHFTVQEERHFGLYDFLARVVHPLMVKPDEPRYVALINEVAAKLALDLEEFGEMSRVLFLVLRKKSRKGEKLR